MAERSASVKPCRSWHDAVWAVNILRGQLSDPTPEERLWMAVIEQAVREGYASIQGDPKRRSEAREWLASKRFSEVVMILGLDPEWARDKIRRLEGRGWGSGQEQIFHPNASGPGRDGSSSRGGEEVNAKRIGRQPWNPVDTEAFEPVASGCARNDR